MAIKLHVETIMILFQSESDFLNDLNVCLVRIGYIPASETKHTKTFKPSFFSGILSGRISTQLRENIATIIGPSMYMKEIEKGFAKS